MNDDATQNRSLLLVHGRDFKPAAATYLELAVTAMRTGLTRDYPDSVAAFDALPIDLAWYGDLNAEVLERGGFQTTVAYRALRGRWEAGAVLAGSSAGAAMMSSAMISGGSSLTGGSTIAGSRSALR